MIIIGSLKQAITAVVTLHIQSLLSIQDLLVVMEYFILGYFYLYYVLQRIRILLICLDFLISAKSTNL